MYSKSIQQEIKHLIKEEYLDCSIKDFKNLINWHYISGHQKLSEEFIGKFQNSVDWNRISAHQKLSENFIEKFKDKVNWYYISGHQPLSESFIEKFQNIVDWNNISTYQHLTEKFIEKFQSKVVWFQLQITQQLSESFIEKFQNRVNWSLISEYQELSEEFIEKYQDKVIWDYISNYQKLSKEFRKKYDIKISKNNWLYRSEANKVKYIKKNTDYEIKNDESGDRYLEVYKSIRSDYYSVFNFQYKYEVGKTYESRCDYNLDKYNSFGLSSWTKNGALDYHNHGRLLRVKVYIKDIGAISEEGKVRSSKLTVIEEIFNF